MVAMNSIATTGVGGEFRRGWQHEVPAQYVANFMRQSARGGLELVAEEAGGIVGEIYAYTPRIECFVHVLSELTIGVSPAH